MKLFIAASIRLLTGCLVFAASLQQAASQPLRYPWAGGMNSCQYCNIDLNLDGTPDLLVFDRMGNRKLTFLAGTGGEGLINDQQYAMLLPALHDWVITADYNCDGKEDIFTYGSGGMRVFENISDTVIRFRLITNLLKSFYYTSYIGILLTSVDYPAISDIDNDGDLDILTFFGLGSFVEYHRNMSMEKFGNCDSLDYRLEAHCWGNFKESEGSNVIQLGVTCPYACGKAVYSPDGPRHTGSTMLAIDLNGDDMKDLVLGDVDFPDLISLINGGTPDSANMISQDSLFPGLPNPVRLFSFPSSSFTDVNNDGAKDLVVSPFDANLYISENLRSSWLYTNSGTDADPVFTFTASNFLQGDMLDFGSASYPLFSDLNGDGLEDLLTGSYGSYDTSYYFQGVLHTEYTGKVAYFKNTGSGFRYVTYDLANTSELHQTGVYPAAGDLNGDGFPDLITGSSDGTLVYYQNAGTGSDPPSFLAPRMNYQEITTGTFSAPQIFDLDKDGLPDIITGERKGTLSYFRNTGSAVIPVFTLVTSFLGKIDVTNDSLSTDGFSTPFFFRDEDGTTRLVVGSDEGRIYYFVNIDNNLGGTFTPSDSLFALVDSVPFTALPGWRSAPSLYRRQGAPYMDLVTGNFSGGLNYYASGPLPDVISAIDGHGVPETAEIKIFPNPANNEVTIRLVTGNPLPISYSLYTLAGIRLLEGEFSNQTTIDTRYIESGFYILHFTSASGGSSARKLLIFH